MRPSNGRDRTSAATTPPAAPRFVLISRLPMAVASAAPPRASWEPPLNPNQPIQRMKTPRVTIGTLDGGVALTLPSERNLPRRAPTMMIPASAAQPPVEWTIVEPAKSWKPRSKSQPSPQVQAPTIG